MHQKCYVFRKIICLVFSFELSLGLSRINAFENAKLPVFNEEKSELNGCE